MSVASALALAMAERVEKTGGPRAGLVAWKTLAGNSPDAETRARALLSALRCAVVLRDQSALGELCEKWRKVDRGIWDVPIAVLCKKMVRAGILPRAIELARAEAQRERTARSLYVYARCLELGQVTSQTADQPIAAAFEEAIVRSGREGARDIELAARIRRLAILSRSWMTMAEALDESRRIDLGQLTPTSKLVIVQVQLVSSSRFVRAAAIDTLDEIIRQAAEAKDLQGAASHALALAARFVDDVGDALSPLEIDRLVALFGRPYAVVAAPRAKLLMLLLARIARAQDETSLNAALAESASVEPLLAKSNMPLRDVLHGRFHVLPDVLQGAPADPAERRAFRHEQILGVAVGLRDNTPARAAQYLRELDEAEARGEHLPREVLGVARAALVSDAPELREIAVRIFARRLQRPGFGVPPHGFLSLAEVLAAMGKSDLSLLARRAAAVVKEPGGTQLLATALTKSGWDLARLGARTDAIGRLREAKRLLEG